MQDSVKACTGERDEALVRVKELEEQLEDCAFYGAFMHCALDELHELSDFDGGRFSVAFCIDGEKPTYHLFNELSDRRPIEEPNDDD